MKIVLFNKNHYHLPHFILLSLYQKEINENIITFKIINDKIEIIDDPDIDYSYYDYCRESDIDYLKEHIGEVAGLEIDDIRHIAFYEKLIKDYDVLSSEAEVRIRTWLVEAAEEYIKISKEPILRIEEIDLSICKCGEILRNELDGNEYIIADILRNIKGYF